MIALRFLFAGERELVTCEDAADVDDDGRLAVADPIHLLTGLFQGGAAPPAPFPDCGDDPTFDALGCGPHEVCASAFTIGGHRFAADGTFFVIDRSGTMTDMGELPRAKQEILQALDGLKERSVLGIVFFDKGILKFPADGVPLAADAEGKAEAQRFIQSSQRGVATCPAKGLEAALDFADVSTARQDEVFFFSDGGGTCPDQQNEEPYLRQSLDDITARNSGRVRIHAIGVLNLTASGEQFLKTLAERNRGVFIQIN